MSEARAEEELRHVSESDYRRAAAEELGPIPARCRVPEPLAGLNRERYERIRSRLLSLSDEVCARMIPLLWGLSDGQIDMVIDGMGTGPNPTVWFPILLELERSEEGFVGRRGSVDRRKVCAVVRWAIGNWFGIARWKVPEEKIRTVQSAFATPSIAQSQGWKAIEAVLREIARRRDRFARNPSGMIQWENDPVERPLLVATEAAVLSIFLHLDLKPSRGRPYKAHLAWDVTYASPSSDDWQSFKRARRYFRNLTAAEEALTKSSHGPPRRIGRPTEREKRFSIIRVEILDILRMNPSLLNHPYTVYRILSTTRRKIRTSPRLVREILADIRTQFSTESSRIEKGSSDETERN